MFSGTIENGRVTLRKYGQDGLPTYDVWHCHPHLVEYPPGGGVMRTSTLHVYLREALRGPKAGAWAKVQVALWVPGGVHLGGGTDVTPDGQAIDLAWGQEIWTPVTAWGNPQVVSLSRAPLMVVWESVPGRTTAPTS